ncbi:hypothetical protein S1361_38075 [Streptomyces cyanogenus]|uniref:Uncharacterized protein n=1 Tax=Streptomyces cyanogenus TaxID=80860 RepID=A0ABX7TJ61_STRCY|nr:hypothetical protein S1361_00425 [Streptomyces cyanogenus]QTE03207.1 hypothetical protein S1361_38075 [Streptomyces cyanogenus]
MVLRNGAEEAGGNRNDVTQLLPLLNKIPAVAGVVGRPRRGSDVTASLW